MWGHEAGILKWPEWEMSSTSFCVLRGGSLDSTSAVCEDCTQRERVTALQGSLVVNIRADLELWTHWPPQASGTIILAAFLAP